MEKTTEHTVAERPGAIPRRAGIYLSEPFQYSFSPQARWPRRLAGHVELDPGLDRDQALERAFARAQNIDCLWNEELPCRSLSVGDCVELDGRFFLCLMRGWEEITAADAAGEGGDAPAA
jgi:hypothetical protein